ncbi:peptidylprolyl isomerase [Ottowia sp.]|uniref:peptidylprolyl isomerase n=1 Tax=Ottowia sp. TaxID=1898956 RepID=UPI003A87A91A
MSKVGVHVLVARHWRALGVLAATLVAASSVAIGQTNVGQAQAANAAQVSAVQSFAPEDVLVSGPAGRVTRAELEMVVPDLVPPEDQARFWRSPDAVINMARGLYTRRALAQEAVREGLDKTPQAATQLRLKQDQVLTDLLLQQRVTAATPDAAALDRMAQSEYRAHPEQFTSPEEVRVRHILLPVAPDGSNDAAVKADAQALIGQLKNGADFAALAKARSVDRGSAQRGGDIGFFAKGKMLPEFESAAFALKQVGDLSAPVKTKFGYHIIELRERKLGEVKTFEQALPELRAEQLHKVDTRARRSAWEKGEAGAQVDEAGIKSWLQNRAQIN